MNNAAALHELNRALAHLRRRQDHNQGLTLRGRSLRYPYSPNTCTPRTLSHSVRARGTMLRSKRSTTKQLSFKKPGERLFGFSPTLFPLAFDTLLCGACGRVRSLPRTPPSGTTNTKQGPRWTEPNRLYATCSPR